MANCCRFLIVALSSVIVLTVKAASIDFHQTIGQVGNSVASAENELQTRAVTKILMEASSSRPQNDDALTHIQTNAALFQDNKLPAPVIDYAKHINVDSKSMTDKHRESDKENKNLLSSEKTSNNVLHTLIKRSREDSYHSRCCYVDVLCSRGCRRPWERVRQRRSAEDRQFQEQMKATERKTRLFSKGDNHSTSNKGTEILAHLPHQVAKAVSNFNGQDKQPTEMFSSRSPLNLMDISTSDKVLDLDSFYPRSLLTIYSRQDRHTKLTNEPAGNDLAKWRASIFPWRTGDIVSRQVASVLPEYNEHTHQSSAS